MRVSVEASFAALTRGEMSLTLVAWFARIGNSGDSGESAECAIKIGVSIANTIRANRFARIVLRIARSTKSLTVRAGFRQNGFFADFYFWAAGFFRGFPRRIFSPHFCGKKCPEKSSRKIPGKILQILYNKNPLTHFCRLARATFWRKQQKWQIYVLPTEKKALLLKPPEKTKMTKMAGVTRAKAWFRKSRVA